MTNQPVRIGLVAEIASADSVSLAKTEERECLARTGQENARRKSSEKELALRTEKEGARLVAAEKEW